MKKELIRMLLNGLFCIIATLLTRHYYDLGLVTIGGTYRVFVICIIHMIYVGITFVKRCVEIENSQKEA